MKTIIITFCLFTVCSAILFPFFSLPNQSQQTMMRICIYSVNPNQYQPKCFLCPTSVYPNVALTCVNATSLPANIKFEQANCVEQNCMIRRGRRSADEAKLDGEVRNYENEIQTNHQSLENSATSNDENTLFEELSSEAEVPPYQSQVVRTEELFASDNEDYVEDFEDEDN